MSTIQLDPEIEARLEALAVQTGVSKSDHVQEAVLSYLEDLEDCALAAERLKSPGRRWALEEVERAFGLDDRAR
jgi:RHH-type rel operon transcriptional repressor/antitoxin RelB